MSEEITDSYLIAKTYVLSGQFFIDLASSIPFDVFVQEMFSDGQFEGSTLQTFT